MIELPRFPTQLVGSWCKPHWLCDHEKVYDAEGTWWRVAPEHLDEAHDDAVRLAIADQERAGLTFVTDGEQRRQTFSGHFTLGLGGLDTSPDAQSAPVFRPFDVAEYMTMKPRPVPAECVPARPRTVQPRVVGPVQWLAPMVGPATAFLEAGTRCRSKVTVIGPTTLALRLIDEHYGALDELAFALADALNVELRLLEQLGVDLIQLDEPEVHFRYSSVAPFATEALNRALRGVTTPTAVHVCYGYSKNIAEKRATPVYAQALDLLAASTVGSISLEYAQPNHAPDLLEHCGTKGVILGVLDLDTEAPVESVDGIAWRAAAAVEVVGPQRLALAPDCGMWFLPRAKASAKIAAMEQAAHVLRSRHG